MPLRLADAFVVRTPILSSDTLTTLLDRPSTPDGEVARLFADPLIQEAVFLASPVLYDEVQRWLGGTLTRPDEARRVKRSLLKYLSRMATRATPFGLFAGCSIGLFGEERAGALEGRDAIRRSTRLDMNLVCQLAQRLVDTPDIRAHLRFFSNSTLYAVGRDVRYFESWYDKDRRRHYRLVSVEGGPYLQKVLAAARCGARLDVLAAAIVDADVSLEEALQYVNDLVDNQVFTSELEPAISDPQFLGSMIAQMPESPGGREARQTLQEIQVALHRFDEAGPNAAGAYRDVRSTIQSLAPEASLEALFQVDFVRPATLTLEPAIKTQLMFGLRALNRLSPRVPLERLDAFRKAFRERFEDREVPLLHALDADIGVPYGPPSAAVAPLLEGLQTTMPPDEDTGRPVLGVVEQLLLPRIWEALLAGQDEVRLQDGDLEPLPLRWDDLPPTFSVAFSVGSIDGNTTVVIQGAGGSTAAASLGRFAHLDQDLRRHVEAVTAHEDVFHEGKVVAEILHLPEDCVGNVLLHPPFRTHEIPCLARATVGPEHIVALDELTLSVPHAGPPRLWSSRLGVEVVPALSNAHRYTSEELLPVYRLLGDLQAPQARLGLRFPHETLLHALPRLPRIVYRQCVLSPARWWFRGARLSELLERLTGSVDACDAWRLTHRMPRRVLLVKNDNELYVDLANAECRDLLASELRQKKVALFAEVLWPGDHPWIHGPDGHYCHEVLATCMREMSDITRSFQPGSRWAYFKVYCGETTADRLVHTTIAPLADDLEREGVIRGWFFLRYVDPSHHLRVRFDLAGVDGWPIALARVHECLAEPIRDGLVWKVQTDTYERELERYGSETMELSERLFYRDSQLAARAIALVQEAGNEDLRWQFGLMAMMRMLDEFGLSLPERLRLLDGTRVGLLAEHEAAKILGPQLNQRYREKRDAIEDALDQDRPGFDRRAMFVELLDARAEATVADRFELLSRARSGRLTVPLGALHASYLHMFCNRLFVSRQRLHELVLVTFLAKHIHGRLARITADSLS